jgi:hypothetical protein
MHVVDSLEDSHLPPPRSLLPPHGGLSWVTKVTVSFLLAGLVACSSDDKAGDAAAAGSSAVGGGASEGGSAAVGGSGGSGGSAASAPFGNFTLVLNPAVEDAPGYTSLFGKVYNGPYPTDVIETVIASDDNCKVYKYSLQACFDPSCTGEQTCVAMNVCEAKPTPVSVGDVSVTGVGDSSLKLSVTNLNYQYPLELPYPGVTEGEPVTLTGSGGAFSAFTVSAKGVAPIATSESTYLIEADQPITLNWTPGASSAGAEVTATLNVSKHGGSAGYALCTTTDSGTLTIAADVLKALVELGVGGFPELLLRRSTHGESTVDGGKIALDVEAVAKPALNIEGYCSCFNDSDCGACSDKAMTSCDPLKRLCKTP